MQLTIRKQGENGVKITLSLSLVSIWSSGSSQSSQKMFRQSGRSYGNTTQTIANDPDDWDDLDCLDRVEFYPDDRVNFEAKTRAKILLSDPETSLTTPRLLPLRRSRRSYGNYQSPQSSGSSRNILKRLGRSGRSGRSCGNQALGESKQTDSVWRLTYFTFRPAYLFGYLLLNGFTCNKYTSSFVFPLLDISSTVSC